MRPLLLFLLCALILVGCVHRPQTSPAPVEWRPALAGGLLVASSLHAGASTAAQRHGDDVEACAHAVLSDVTAAGAATVLATLNGSAALADLHLDLTACAPLDVHVPDGVLDLRLALLRALSALDATLAAYVRDCDARTWLAVVLARLRDAVDPIAEALTAGASTILLPARYASEVCP